MATNLVKKNRVNVNGEEVKPAKEIKIGDQISIKKNTAVFTYEVLDVLDKRVGAKHVDRYVRDITPEEEVEKFRAYQAAQREYRQFGLGKPTKKQRRDLGKFRGE